MWDKEIQAKGKVRQSSQKCQSQRQEFLSTYNSFFRILFKNGGNGKFISLFWEFKCERIEWVGGNTHSFLFL